jgi:hypothetical protein
MRKREHGKFVSENLTPEERKVRHRENQRRYREKRGEAYRDYVQQYNETHREHLRQLNRDNYAANREEILAKRKEKYRENLDENRRKNRELSAEWRAKNHDKVLLQRFRHKPRRRITARVYQATQRAKEYGCLIGDLDAIRDVYDWILNAEVVCCEYCGQPCGQSIAGRNRQATVEHRTPLSRQGDHDVTNLSVACSECNSMKCARTAEEFHAFRISLGLTNK